MKELVFGDFEVELLHSNLSKNIPMKPNKEQVKIPLANYCLHFICIIIFSLVFDFKNIYKRGFFYLRKVLRKRIDSDGIARIKSWNRN